MRYKKVKNRSIVYSTEHGRMCPTCGKPVAECMGHQKYNPPKGDGIVRMSRETKGRKGKSVSVITGVPLDHAELKKFGQYLKIKCGTGGTVKSGVIEIQGDHRDILVEELKKQGWTVKLSGG